MFKRILVTSLILVAPSLAQADPGLFVGVAYTFGQGDKGFGLTLKVTSSDKEDHAIVAAGVSYYPMQPANKFGVDAGVGYNFSNAAVTLGWDFLQKATQLAVGFADTDDDTPAAAPPSEEETEV
jgi:hypothetical protein